MKKFWFVMIDDTEGGCIQAEGTLPRVRHLELNTAEREAERLARANPGIRFIVLEAKCSVMKPDVQWETAEAELPF